MPAEFLTEEQKSQYGRFSGEPNDVQLARYFHLDDTDLSCINKRRRDYNRLGFTLQLTTVRFLGAFLVNPIQVPRNVVHCVAQQVGIARLDCLEQYLARKITRYAHSTEIQTFYGYHDFNALPWRFRLSRLLYSKAWVSNERPSLMFDYATSWLIQHKILLPGVSVLCRLISEIRERANKRLWQLLSSLPTSPQKQKLVKLLEAPKAKRISPFEQLRQGPTTVSGPAFNDPKLIS